MERKLLEYNKARHLKLVDLLNGDLKEYQTLFETVKSNLPDFEATLPDLEDLVSDAPGYLLDHTMKGKDMTFNGLPISRKKALEMVEFPENYNLIVQAAKHFKNALKMHKIADDQYPALDFSNLDLQGGSVSIKPDYLLKVEADFCRYTANDKQVKALDAINEIIRQIAILKGLGMSNEYKMTLGTLGIDADGEKPKVDIYKVIRLK